MILDSLISERPDRSSQGVSPDLEAVARAIRDIDNASSPDEMIEATLGAACELLQAETACFPTTNNGSALSCCVGVGLNGLGAIYENRQTLSFPLTSNSAIWADASVVVIGQPERYPVDNQAYDAVEALVRFLSAALERFNTSDPSLEHPGDAACLPLSRHLARFDSPVQIRNEAVTWLADHFNADAARLVDLVPDIDAFPGLLPETTNWIRNPRQIQPALEPGADLTEEPDTGSGQRLNMSFDVEGRPDVLLSLIRSVDDAEWTTQERSLFQRAGAVVQRHLIRSIHAQRASIRASCLQALHRLTTLTAASTTMTELCRTVHLAADQLIPSDEFRVTLWPPDDIATTVYRAEGDQVYPSQPAIAPTVKAMESAGPSIVSYLPDGADSPQDPFGDFPRNVRSIMTAPLLAKGTPIGLLSAQSYRPHAFQWEHAEMLASIAQSAVGAFERHILLEQMSRQTRRDAALRAVAERINSTLDTEELLTVATDAIFDTLRSALVLVSLIDRTTDRVWMRAFRSSDREFSPPPLGYTLREDSLTFAALQRSAQIAVSDCAGSPYSTFRFDPWPAFGSAVATPIVIDSQRAGIIVLAKFETEGFVEEELSMQRQIAALLSTALQNTTAYANRLRHASDLSELQRLGSTIASQLDLSKSLAEIVDSARMLVDADGCAVGMLDGSELVVVSAVGSVAGVIPDRLPVDGMLLQRVVETARPMAINDLAAGVPGLKVDSIPLSVARGWMAVPLVDPEGATVGVIGVFTTEPRKWDERDQSLLATLGASSALAIKNACHFEGTRDLLRASVESLTAAVEAKDPFTRNHSRHVARYSRLIAEELGLDAETVGQIELAALLHDVGKIGIPDSVLEKGEALDPAEWAAVHLHPVIGEQILSGNPILQPLLPMVRHHHERWDGHGYPDRLKQTEIPVGSTIIAVAEAVDAIISDRPYQPARPWSSAVSEIHAGRGNQFSPDVVDAFIRSSGQGEFSDIEVRTSVWAPTGASWNARRVPPLDVRALHIFEEVANEIRAGANLESFLHSVVSMLKNVLDVPYIALYVKSDQESELGLLVSLPDLASTRGLAAHLQSGGGIVGWVAENGILQNIPDVSLDERYFDGGYAGQIRSELCVPLLAEGDVIGVLNLESDLPNAFSEMDERLMISTSDHIASAIHVVQLHDRLKKLSATDALTGLHNHRSFFEHLVAETNRAISEGCQLTIAILDVNDLKAINDNYGHLTGDAALRAVAKIVEQSRRELDIVCRYGGDEFAIILPGTSTDEGWNLLDAITAELASGTFEVDGLALPLPTASWGTATAPEDGHRPIELLSIADERMYLQKRRMSI